MTDEPLSCSHSPLPCALSLRIQDETHRYTKHNVTRQSRCVIKHKDLAPAGTRVKGCRGAQCQAVCSKHPPSTGDLDARVLTPNLPPASPPFAGAQLASATTALCFSPLPKPERVCWRARRWQAWPASPRREHGLCKPGMAATAALFTQGTWRGTAWLQFQTREGKIRGTRGKQKKSSPSSHKGQRGRAGGGGRARGGERAAVPQ